MESIVRDACEVEPFPLWFVVKTYDKDNKKYYYAGPDGVSFWTTDIKKAKYFRKPSDAKKAIQYHCFTGTHLEYFYTGRVVLFWGY